MRSTDPPHTGSVAAACRLYGLGCQEACEIFLDQGLNLCLLYWQADSYPLHHQGNPLCPFVKLGYLPLYCRVALSDMDCCWWCSVAKSCPTLCDPVDCSPPGSSVRGTFPGKNTGMGCHFLSQGDLPDRDRTCIFCTGRRIPHH